MTSRTQLLIHEGELNEILTIVDNARGNKAVGRLYGLWRHSLTQPVIHLAIGPGAKAKLDPCTFYQDTNYSTKCKTYLADKHGLIQIGLWVAGDLSRYHRLDPHRDDFCVNLLLPGDGKYCVIMCVKTEPVLSVEFTMVDRHQPKNSKTERLCQEDVLDGDSCFRLLPQVSKIVSKDAMKFKSSKKTSRRAFRRTDLASLSDPRQPVLTSPNQQWYENVDGGGLLARLMNTFEKYGVTVSMSRSTNSHDMTFELDSKLSLHFPRTFPDEEPSFSLVNHNVLSTRDQEEISRRLVEQVIKVLRAI